MQRLFIRVLFERGVLGPGKAQLLELVRQTGSIRAAAAAMKMSYRRAWMLLAETEKIFGASVLERRTGGKSGGGAALTPLGREIVKHYRALEKNADRAARAEIAALGRLRR